MPGVDVAAGTLAVPIWLAGAAAAAFVVAILLAAKRAGGVALITSLFRVGLIAAGVLGAWLYVQQRDVSERRALDDRKTALMAGSIAPGSALSCLDELAGEAVEAACEKGVFASPEAVAAAVKYVAAQLALLDDGTAYAKRSDASYATELAPLRTAVELDRFGLVAQVLKEREGCTVDRCDALTRFRESTRVLGNLRDRTFEEQVKKYTAIWNAPPSGRRAWSRRPGRRSLCRERMARERWRHYREIQPPQNRPCNPPRSLLRPRWEASRRRRRSSCHCGGASWHHRRSRRHCAIRPPQSRPRNPPRSLPRPRREASHRRRRSRCHCGGPSRQLPRRPPQNRPRDPLRSLPRRRLGASRRCRHAGRLRCALRPRRVRSHHSPDQESAVLAARLRIRLFENCPKSSLLGGSSFAALQAFEQSDRFWRPHLLCHLIPGPCLRGICGKTSDAKRIKNIRIICGPEVHGCPCIAVFDQSTQGGPGGFNVNGGEFYRSNSFE